MGKKGKRNSMTSNARQEAEKVDAETQELGGPSFDDLPSAITTHILLTLPVKSVLICRCVCKNWNTLISDPQFAKLHFKHAHVGVMIRTNDPKRVSRTLHLLEYEPEKFDMFDSYDELFCSCEDNFLEPECNSHIKLEPKFKLPLRDAKLVLNKRDETKNGGRKRSYIACKPRDDKFAVVNSCNGLLCLSDPRNGDPLVVCNPITGEFIRFPRFPEATTVEKMKMRKPIYAGFGFHEKTNEYKVIRICSRYVKHPPDVREWMYDDMVVEMHTLGTSTWRNIGGDLKFVHLLRFPTCVNGAIHWICFDGWKGSILCFNFESERFQSLPSPPHVFKQNGFIENGSKCTENMSMGELKGSLYVCVASSYDPINMWVMKKYGIGDSWSKVFSIDPMGGDRWPYGLYWPLKHFKKGAAVLMYHSCNCFIYYEPKKYGFKIFKVRGSQSKFEAIPHIPSLISLKDAVKGDNVEVLNVHSPCAPFKLREENEVLFLAEENVEVASLYSSSSDGEEYGEEYSS